MFRTALYLVLGVLLYGSQALPAGDSKDGLVEVAKDLKSNEVAKSQVTPFSSEQPTVITEEDIDNDPSLETWDAPFNISRNYIYYEAGTDYDNRPVWIGEAGKWNWKRIVDGGPEYIQAFERYMMQMAWFQLNSWRNASKFDESIENNLAIVDLDGLPLSAVLNVDSLGFFLRLNYRFKDLIARNFGNVLVINTNSIALTVINAIRPILGEVFERIEVYGTNKDRWMPELLRRIPKKSLPVWYGGTKDFTPVKVIG